MMPEKKDDCPLTYRIAAWYGFIISGIFLLYGGVKIVLSILDRNYDDLSQPILFLVLGMILISFAFAYNELKKWGWYGLIVINSLIIISAAVGYDRYENIILLIFSAAALYALFSSSTKEYLFGRR